MLKAENFASKGSFGEIGYDDGPSYEDSSDIIKKTTLNTT